METVSLPIEFEVLAPFSSWCLPTERERYEKRLGSSMLEMQAFYDAITPIAQDAISYCDKFDLHDLPEEIENLLYLLYSMITVSFSVECWSQPRIPDSGAASLDCLVEPTP
ncbi:hypothetical protein [Williamsia sp.]|uniref:hypothetical protein n=1 Tax=Williamsia sp. TaxID=1872085 RepID=UPI002F95723F